MANISLSNTKSDRKDEFYTELKDIQAELSHYGDKFKDKVVFCNCDDPFESNFVKYFLMNFNRLELKELIAVGYKTSPFGGDEIGEHNNPYVLRVNSTSKYLVGTQKDLDIAGAKYFLEAEGKNVMTPLIGNDAYDENGNRIIIQEKESYIDERTGKKKNRTVKKELYYEAGDFRSDMSIELLKQSDVVVTNPPFSLFREFVGVLIKYDKQFLIIGNQNAITYKEFFPLLKENKVWLGYGFKGNVGYFRSPYEDKASSSQHQVGKIRVSGITWFTNIDHPKRHQKMPIDFGYTYTNHNDMYPKYDNYDAVEVSKTNQIPCDYTGVMGVPITFLDYFCPEQFEIVGLSAEGNDSVRCNPSDHYDGYEWFYGKNKEKSHRISSWMPLLSVSEKGGTQCTRQGSPDLYQMYWRVFIRFTKEYITAHPEQFHEGAE